MRLKTLLTTIAVGAVSVAMAGSVAAQEYTFKLHHMLPATSPAQKSMLEPWAAQVEENSGGRVKIEMFPAMTLGGTPPELVQQARDGVVDIIWTVNGYTPGQFPRTEVFELPGVYLNDISAANKAMYDMFDEYLADDYKGLEVMWLHVHAGQAIMSVDTEIRSPEDMSGLKIRIPSRTGGWVIEALGASPIAMPVPEVPAALSKKVVDATFLPWEIIPVIKAQDQIQYFIEGANETRFGTTTFQVSMNQGKWDSLPDDIKAAFKDASGREWWDEVGNVWRAGDDFGIKMAEDSGREHIMLSEEETNAFITALEPVQDRWIEEVTAKGMDGAALVEMAKETIAENTDK
ncbi:TRAP transporter substrate-binding protein [Psychromarinibacter halotolerans]|uniref:TRAP transporter substrate-binding protein n=1 Tax=Psychromarinibacter halotolerans TaxID=1775175 RepID=A0ABV7GJP0_9RHOB|nr:TRAP transporter substrate-binding protein [Psychromarinibacter halotolerans]MAQ82162.1 C4-dicarboxylate ABC transporter substrate-binding protein [Maritimibacter sp.]MDF0595745.1 TRAP transporter substrate-binding protein [Psychromarinibacter halotolerans]